MLARTRRALLAAAVALAAVATGCGDPYGSFFPSYVRVANLHPGTTIDFCYGRTSQAEYEGPVLIGLGRPDGQPETGLAYGEVSRYGFVYSGLYFVRAIPFGQTTCSPPLPGANDTLMLLERDQLGTVVLVGPSPAYPSPLLVWAIDEWTPDPGALKIRFANASYDPAAVDVGFGTLSTFTPSVLSLEWMTTAPESAVPPVDALGFAWATPDAREQGVVAVRAVDEAGADRWQAEFPLTGVAATYVSAGTVASAFLLGDPVGGQVPTELLLCADSRGPEPGTNRSQCAVIPAATP